MAQILLVHNDTGPNVEATVLYEDGTPVNLSATTVRLYFRAVGATALKATITGTYPNGGTDGVVRFRWPQGATDTAGQYEGEVEIDFGAGEVQTLYEILRFRIRHEFA